MPASLAKTSAISLGCRQGSPQKPEAAPGAPRLTKEVCYSLRAMQPIIGHINNEMESL